MKNCIYEKINTKRKKNLDNSVLHSAHFQSFFYKGTYKTGALRAVYKQLPDVHFERVILEWHFIFMVDN